MKRRGHTSSDVETSEALSQNRLFDASAAQALYPSISCPSSNAPTLCSVALEDALAALAREVAAALIKFADSVDGVHLEERPAVAHPIPGVPTTAVQDA